MRTVYNIGVERYFYLLDKIEKEPLGKIKDMLMEMLRNQAAFNRETDSIVTDNATKYIADKANETIQNKSKSELPTHAKGDGMGFKGQRSN